MNEYYLRMYFSLRSEIEYWFHVVTLLPWLFLAAVGLMMYVSKKAGYEVWIVFAFVLLTFLPSSIALTDLKLHRPVPYIEEIEKISLGQGAPLPGWEEWKAGRLATKALLIFDLKAAVPVIILYGYLFMQVLSYVEKFYPEKRLPVLLVWIAPFIFVIECVSIWYATVLARK